jgi:6-phosphogluconolactonase (cycloisomerase 2 family)
MKLSLFGRLTMALLASAALGLGMTACGGGTIAYLWVLGQQYNQIAGFKVDDYTGNLTTVPTSPFSTGGAIPVSLVVKPGGRYIYVVNQGTGGTSTTAGSGQDVVEFAVGGDGTLTYEDTFYTQGYISQWAQFDSTGTYLYVLDKYSPDGTGSGAITTFAADPNTGRLTLVTNSETKTGQGLNTYFWDVGVSPIMMKTVGSCLFTLNSSSANQSVTPYTTGANGQLVTDTTGNIPLTTTSATSINGNASYVYITDSNNGNATNYIDSYSVGSGCNLQPGVGGSANKNVAGVYNPVYSMIDNSGKYVFVLNYSNPNTIPSLPSSTITAFTISGTNGQLTQNPNSPFTVGSGPVCMVEDPTSKYVYTSNHFDGTITGKAIDPTEGNLTDLVRGSTFTAAGQASCLVLSGAVD